MITRGLAEMTRIGVAYGASPLTFLTLAGVGDLFLTCSSSSSRNYTVGYRLGKGETLESILETLGSVAEGVTTAKSVKSIIDDLGIRASIASGVRSYFSRWRVTLGCLCLFALHVIQTYEILYEGQQNFDFDLTRN